MRMCMRMCVCSAVVNVYLMDMYCVFSIFTWEMGLLYYFLFLACFDCVREAI